MSNRKPRKHPPRAPTARQKRRWAYFWNVVAPKRNYLPKRPHPSQGQARFNPNRQATPPQNKTRGSVPQAPPQKTHTAANPQATSTNAKRQHPDPQTPPRVPDPAPAIVVTPETSGTESPSSLPRTETLPRAVTSGPFPQTPFTQEPTWTADIPSHAMDELQSYLEEELFWTSQGDAEWMHT
ncbi:hypothetical protein CSIM01_04893 [Colletotrichum simmondsii]|uniref:Uncharacterized protein n=1 Tax=Colletotrichum simmondsii TaxID=703756 RepID=A0A135TK78_9PEZI|nr:hypothetical protein CSIM01_04893 [Colletotrichum simmondsii]